MPQRQQRAAAAAAAAAPADGIAAGAEERGKGEGQLALQRIVSELGDASAPREAVVDALTRLCGILHMHRHDTEYSKSMAACCNPLVAALAQLMGDAVACGAEWGSPVVTQTMHATLHALTQMLEHTSLVPRALDCDSIRLLLHHLICSLLHPRLAALHKDAAEVGTANGSGSQVDEAVKETVRSMNALLMHLLQQAQPNRILSVLIGFLYSDAQAGSAGALPADSAERGGENKKKQKLMDAVLKCLLDMTRRMRCYIDELDIDLLLLDIHDFLTLHPPSLYRGFEFKPLRLLKTIINELVRLKGSGIRRHLTLVPVDTNPTLVRQRPLSPVSLPLPARCIPLPPAVCA
jgi:hypothetical protein